MSRPTEDELKLSKPWIFDPCWKCGTKNYDNRPNYDSQAVISVRCGDGSYTGTFHLPLCHPCAGTLHNNLPEAYRIL